MTDERGPAFTDAYLFGEMVKDRPSGDQSIIGTAYTRLSMDKRREFWRLTDEEREDVVLGWLAQRHALDGVLASTQFVEPQEGGDYPLREVREEMGKLMDEKVARPIMDSGYVTVEEAPTAAQMAWGRTKQSGDALRRMQARREAGESPSEVMRHTKHAQGCFQAAEDDEPIFTLRAKDAFAPAVVLYWVTLVANAGFDANSTDNPPDWEHLNAKLEDARHCARVMVEWQRNNGHKIPD